MKAQSVLLVMVFFVAAGCAGPKPDSYWYHPDRTLKQARVDYDECQCKAQEEAEKAVEEGYFEGMRSPTRLSGDEQPPARKSGSDDPAAQARADWSEFYKQKAFDGCMQSRTYVKLRAHQVSPSLKTKELPMGAIAGK